MATEREVAELIDEINELKVSVKEKLKLLEEKTNKLESLVANSNDTAKESITKEATKQEEKSENDNLLINKTEIDEKTRRDIMSSLLEKYSN